MLIFSISKRLIVCSFIYLLACLPLAAIRVATLNLNNYLLADRSIDGHYYTHYPKPEAEKKALHQTLLKIRPDILALQEMGDSPFLKELQEDLKRQGLDYPYAILLQGPDPQRHLAVLSQIEPLKVKKHANISFKYFKQYANSPRGLLELWFKGKNTEWALYAVHLKSRYQSNAKDPESKLMRKAEAYALRNTLQAQVTATTPYLVVGDFNDHPYSAPLRAFLKKGDSFLTTMLPAYDSRLEAWTFHNSKMDVYSRLDYILASQAMLKYLKTGSAHIEDGLPHSLNASDHRLIYVDLVF
jgi:endonuclease/exonuclease/phosphatase family metal-dependent hydrolase